jgi:hypothetical protein
MSMYTTPHARHSNPNADIQGRCAALIAVLIAETLTVYAPGGGRNWAECLIVAFLGNATAKIFGLLSCAIENSK